MGRLLRREGKFFDFFNQHADLAAKAALELQALLADLSQLELRSRAIEKNEKQADRVFRTALAKLFREEADPKEIIKQKEVYQLLEAVTDKCEDVANLIEGIVLESA